MMRVIASRVKVPYSNKTFQIEAVVRIIENR
jgi:hypothetical protein